MVGESHKNACAPTLPPRPLTWFQQVSALLHQHAQGAWDAGHADQVVFLYCDRRAHLIAIDGGWAHAEKRRERHLAEPRAFADRFHFVRMQRARRGAICVVDRTHQVWVGGVGQFFAARPALVGRDVVGQFDAVDLALLVVFNERGVPLGRADRAEQSALGMLCGVHAGWSAHWKSRLMKGPNHERGLGTLPHASEGDLQVHAPAIEYWAEDPDLAVRTVVILQWSVVKVGRRQLDEQFPHHVLGGRDLAHGAARAASVDQEAMSFVGQKPDVLQRIIQLDRETDGPRGIVHTSTPR